MGMGITLTCYSQCLKDRMNLIFSLRRSGLHITFSTLPDYSQQSEISCHKFLSRIGTFSLHVPTLKMLTSLYPAPTQHITLPTLCSWHLCPDLLGLYTNRIFCRNLCPIVHQWFSQRRARESSLSMSSLLLVWP